MVRKIILTVVLLAGIAAGAAAQNAIDRLIDDYSSVGRSRFTSAVERDPKTRRVKKVVNVLCVYDANISRFVNAFKGEAHTGDFTEERSGGKCVMVLTVRKAGQNRIYMMQYFDSDTYASRGVALGEVKITSIVNYK